MRYLNDPDALLVFAGQWLWPQLDALAQWGDQLRDLRIIAPAEEDAPGGSARRLADFARRFFPDLSVEVLGPVADDPVAVQQIIGALPTDRRWLLDASGCSRMTSVGALLSAQQRQDLRLVHREPSGPWFELDAAGKMRQIQGITPWATDRFTVESLLDVTWSEGRRVARVLNTKVEPEIEQAAAETLDGAGWRSCFAAATAEIKQRDPQAQAGHLFEKFILSLVRGLGVAADDVALSAVLFDRQIPLQEVDVVVNSNGRLHVIDCKLTNAGMGAPIGMQIRDAEATRRHLGDDADQYILLRPSLRVPEQFRSLCQRYGLAVVDAQTLDEHPLPQVLADLIRPAERTGWPAHPPATVNLPIDQGVIDLHTGFIQSRDSMLLVDMGSFICVKCSPGHGLRMAAVKQAIQTGIGALGEIMEITQNVNRTTFTVVVRARSQKEAAGLREALLGVGKQWG